jgi:hypothetical protein
MIPLNVMALSPEAQEFMRITKELEPVQCEKRQLRRKIVLADVEQRSDDARKLRQRFADLNRDAKTTQLEKRLAELEKRITNEDLPAINRQHVEAFYRCE